MAIPCPGIQSTFQARTASPGAAAFQAAKGWSRPPPAGIEKVGSPVRTRPRFMALYMRGCSPAVKSLFDAFRARRTVRACAMPLHATHPGRSPAAKPLFDAFRARRTVRACAMPLHATHPGRGPLWRISLRVRITAKDPLRSGADAWFSRSRPCDRSTHERSRNSPPFASDEDALGEFRSRSRRQDRPSRFPRHSSFSPRRPCHAGHLLGDDYRGLFPRHPRRQARGPAVRIDPLPRRGGCAAMAPQTGSRRMSGRPISPARPILDLPPVECRPGARPAHAAKSRPRSNAPVSGTRAMNAAAVGRPDAGNRPDPHGVLVGQGRLPHPELGASILSSSWAVISRQAKMPNRASSGTFPGSSASLPTASIGSLQPWGAIAQSSAGRPRMPFVILARAFARFRRVLTRIAAARRPRPFGLANRMPG